MSAVVDVAVLLRRVPDPYLPVRVTPEGGIGAARMTLDPFAAVALEAGLRLREAGAVTSVSAVSVGDETVNDVLRTALAMGADRAVRIAGAGLAAVAEFFCAERFELILCGKQGSDDDGARSAPQLAGFLGRAQADAVSQIEASAEALQVACETPAGRRRFRVPLPAVLGVDLCLAHPRHASLPAVLKARSRPIEVFAASACEPSAPEILGYEGVPARVRSGTRLDSVDALWELLSAEGILPDPSQRG